MASKTVRSLLIATAAAAAAYLVVKVLRSEGGGPGPGGNGHPSEPIPPPAEPLKAARRSAKSGNGRGQPARPRRHKAPHRAKSPARR